MLHLKCKGQEMKVDVDERIADKYINANKVHFEFCERWAGMIITAQFTQKQDGVDKTYDVVVDELTNMVTMPNEIMAGEVHISAFGVDPVTGVRITSIPVKKTIDKSGFVGDGETPVPPTPDLYAQLLEQFGNGVPPSTGANKQLVTDKSGAIVWDNLRVMAGTKNGAVRTSAAAAEQTLGYKLGEAAFAANLETEASGYAAFAAGNGTEAIGKNSFAEGQRTIANGENQHVQGKYNVKDTANKYAHIVGNGMTDAKRSNAHTLDWDGNAWFKGGVYVGGDDQSKGEKLVTKSELDAAVAAGGGGSGEGGGGGLPTGGEPHQMLVTDGEGNAKWEERTHYETFVNSDILPENSPMYIPDTESFMMTEPFVVTPEPGNTYTVVWNGTAFSCTAVMANIDGLDAVYLGNGIVIGGEDTGEPFGIAVLPPDMMEEMGGATGMILPLDGSTDATIAITGGYLAVKKIDEKYLPSIGASNIINGSQTGSVRSRDASEEIGEYAFAFGENVKASGNHSVAFGSDNEATNENAVALGYGCKAVGAVATAIGLSLITDDNTMGQVVLGRYNVASNDILVVGCGSNGTPKNVFTVSHVGAGWFRDTVEGTALILKSSTSGSTKRFKITVDDSGTIKTTAL